MMLRPFFSVAVTNNALLLVAFSLCLALSTWNGSTAWELCSSERGGGACPTGNTCCSVTTTGNSAANKQKGSRCIPNDLGAYNGTCCHDDPTTGCAVGYMCGPEQQCFFVGQNNAVAANVNNNQEEQVEPIDPYVQVLPRYQLCEELSNPAGSSFRHVYGFPVVINSSSTSKNNDEDTDNIAHLWYYSSHGDLLKLSDKKQIQRALILVHGAARNADDYFCVATKAAQLLKQQQQQHHYQRQQSSFSKKARKTKDSISNILVLAPRFVTPTDGPFVDGDDAAKIPNLLQWQDDGSGPWRYGANAILPVAAAAHNISSYDAMDQWVLYLRQHFPNLQHLTIAGHSSGGQFVQRYSLLTSSAIIPSWQSTSSSVSSHNQLVVMSKTRLSKATQQQQQQPLQVRFVVANPSSYAYLTPLRFVEEIGTWTLPKNNDNHIASTTTTTNNSCVPQYNQYPWGLQSSDDDGKDDDKSPPAIVVPYKDRALQELQNNVTALIERFLQQRRVIYLIGSVDRCNISSTKIDNTTSPTDTVAVTAISAGTNTNTTTAALSSDSSASSSDSSAAAAAAVAPWQPGKFWCDSHGLETSCMDEWQGSNRWFRHVHYMNSLKLVGQQLQQQHPPKRTDGNHHYHEMHQHTSDVVEGVGHDHSLIYLSNIGLQALWDKEEGDNND